MTGRKIAAVVFGVLGVLIGVALISGAGFLLAEDRDDDDFFVSGSHRFERSSHAIVSEALDVLSEAPGWVADRLTDPLDVRVAGSSNSGSDLFLGIAASSDVETYLAGVPYDEVDALRFEGADIDYEHHPGTSVPLAPGSKALWVTSVEGPGVQTLDWSVEEGEWSVVVMNADGSSGVDVSLVRGVKLSNLVAVTWGVLAFGAISVLGGGYLLFRGVRRPTAPRAPDIESQRLPEESVEIPEGVERSKVVAKRDKGVRVKTETANQGHRLFEFINRRIVLVSIIVAVLAIVMAGISDAMGSTDEPDSDPSGEIYDTADLVEDTFSFTEGFQRAVFLVEGVDGTDVLTRDGLLEWKTNSAALRADASVFRDDPVNSHLVVAFDTDLGYEVDGVFSLADVVDQELSGGLAGASDADVKLALSELLAADAPSAGLRTTLSRLATVTAGTVAGQDIEIWVSPAFRAEVRYDIDTFEITTTSQDQDVIDNERFLEAERWLRQAQIVLRGDQQNMTAIGLGIDIGLEFEEQAAEAAPFILGAVVVILLVVGGLLRSYWAAAVVGLGLMVSTMIYKGFFALLGFKAGLLLGFIVPVSIISFGVDFFIHAIGRTREAQQAGASRERAYPLGLTAVILALTLAAVSSAVAFASNAVSGIEMITQFGLGAAIAILVAYAILGLIAPKLLLVIEDALGPAPERKYNLHLGSRLGFFLATVVAGVVVAFTVQSALMGAVGAAVFALLFIYLPFRRVRRRNTRAAAAGKAMTDDVKGVGHGLRSAGHVVHFLARWRVVTIPVVVLLAVGGVAGALQVKSEFQFSDFLASDSDVVISIEKSELHFGSIGGSGYIFVQGDLTQPATLEAMEAALAEVTSSGVKLSRDFDGNVVTNDNAVSLARFAVSSAVAVEDIQASTGTAITDNDGDGLPDTSAQVAAVYVQASSEGLRNDAGQVVFAPSRVASILAVDGATQATRLEVGIGSFTDGDIIDAAQGALDDAAANLEADPAAADLVIISVSGDSITTRNGLDAFTKSMLISLPLALVLTFLIATAFLRSFKYAAVSVVPILLVVAWVYGFMYVVDYSINPVTATIAAIAIGVGIDFATHFTVRFREELVGEASRFPALRRAGEGTGGALTISALTSIAGFLVLGLAPMPIFAVYGILTAVMIALALLVTLLVLPSLLLFVTPSLKGEDREALEWERTGGQWVYEPHKRETALQE